MKAFSLISKVPGRLRAIGLRATLSLTLKKLAALTASGSSLTNSPEALLPSSALANGLHGEYEIIVEALKCQARQSASETLNLGRANRDLAGLSFTWLVPFFAKGAGGHKNIFRFIRGLEARGCLCKIYIVGEYDRSLYPKDIRRQIREYFELIEAEVQIYDPQVKQLEADILVSTAWITAYAGITFKANLKLYFVQDYEPLFYQTGSYWYLARNTYSFNYYPITLGPWLTGFLKQKHNLEADYYDIVIEKEVYYPRTEISDIRIQALQQDKNFKVCFYARDFSPRRCFEIAVMALHLLAKEVEELTIVTYGLGNLPPLPFPHVNLGTLEVDELAELYSVCDVCVAPSATNLSLVAHEVMACKCVLIDLEVENTEFNLIHLTNSYLVKPDPWSMFMGLLELCRDPILVNELKLRSLEYAQNLLDWDEQISRFCELVEAKLRTK